MQHVYFPLDCVLSINNETVDGNNGSVALLGRDGFAGSTLLLGRGFPFSKVVVQIPGQAYRLSRECLQAEFERFEEAHARILLLVRYLLTQISQTAFCNRHHTLEQQLCRWLLQTSDLVSGTRFSLQSGLLAAMLGVDTAQLQGVSAALLDRGLLVGQADAIVVPDGVALAHWSCGCARRISTAADTLFGADTHAAAIDA